MNAPANMNTRTFRGHVMIAVLTYTHQVDFRVTQAIEAACFGLAERNWLVTPAIKKGNADLEHSRNTIASEVVMSKQNFTKAVFVDGDVSCERGTIERLVEHPVDLVLGCYRLRNDDGSEKYPLRKLPGPIEFVNPATGEPHPNGLAKIAAGPAGMLCVSRRCIEKMIHKHDNRWFGAPSVTGGKAWPLFEFDIIEHERISEDMNFCRQWRELGEDVWLDPHLTLHHHGDKTFSGCIASHLRDLALVVEPGKMAKVAPTSMQDLL